ncbi:unnamed protein product [Victoria cruziana]
MEQQIGRMADALGQRRIEGSLPSQPLGNPKGKGPVFLVEEPSSSEPYDISTLRSGWDYQPQQQHQQQPYQSPPQSPQYQPPSQPPPQYQPTSSTTTPRGATTGSYASNPFG